MAEIASDQLRSIRGVGPKIAAFWLRDVCDSHDIDLASIGSGEHVQPIDIWVYRAMQPVAVALHNPLPKDLKQTKDSYWRAADLVVRVADEIGTRHTLLNSAVWIFGSQIVSYWGEDLSEVLGKRNGVTNLLADVNKWNDHITKAQRKKAL